MNIIFTVQLHTDHGITAVLADFQVIGSNGIPHPFRPVLLLGFHGILVICHVALGNGVSEDALRFLCIVQSECGTYIEPFEGIQVDVGVTEHAPVSIAVVRVTFQACHRVFTVGVTAHRTCIFSVDVTHRQ